MENNNEQNVHEAETRELSLQEIDEISGGARNDEQAEKLGNSENNHK